jgi:hypothetical protein
MMLAVTLILSPVLAWLSYVDFRELRLPDIGTLSLIAAGILLSFSAGGRNSRSQRWQGQHSGLRVCGSSRVDIAATAGSTVSAWVMLSF